MPDRILNGRYRLGRLLGRGGMAEVYEALDELLARPVAVKMLRSDMAADPEIRSRFEIEARSAARLHHPNVVSVFDTGEDEGEPYLVMERLPGESLADRMAAGPVDPEWLRVVAGDVLAALGAAHDVGLVHRDVKPANVLLTADGQAKVADFGIAKSVEAGRGGDPTSTGLLLGTPAYLAPERIHGDPATARSDLYSLGVVLYEALTGVKPFVGDTALAVATAIATSPAPSLEPVWPGVGPQMISAIERAMAKNPLDRPATAAEMAADLGLTSPSMGAPTVIDAVVPAGGPGAADPTLVSAPSLKVPVREEPADDRRSGLARGTVAGGRGLAPALLAAAAVVVFIVLIALGGGGGDDGSKSVEGTALSTELSELAERVETGDGAKGPEAAERLREVADQVEAGGGGDAATELLVEATEWNQEGELFLTAYNEMVSLLRRVPGADATVLVTTTVAPSVPPPDEDRDDDTDAEGKGKKKRGKG